jgi:hypothetical protein
MKTFFQAIEMSIDDTSANIGCQNIYCSIGANAGKIQPPSNCKILKDGCIARQVRISDETLDCFTGKPYRNTSDSVTFPIAAATPPPNPEPTTTDTLGGVAIGNVHQSKLSKGIVNPNPNDLASLEKIFGKIANNAQSGKRTTFDDLLSIMPSQNSRIQSNAIYPQMPQNPPTQYSSSFQMFGPYTQTDPLSNWLLYNGMMDGSL